MLSAVNHRGGNTSHDRSLVKPLDETLPEQFQSSKNLHSTGGRGTDMKIDNFSTKA